MDKERYMQWLENNEEDYIDLFIETHRKEYDQFLYQSYCEYEASRADYLAMYQD